MKKTLICGALALVLLLAGGTALTKEKGRAREGTRRTKRVAEKSISEEQKQWKAKLQAMTPEQRRLALAQKALEDDLAPWKKVRQIAAEEKAQRTVAAIDKIIAEKQEQFKKKMASAEKRDEAKTDKPKDEGERQTGEKQLRKRRGEAQD